MPVVVTGANGAVGRALIPTLVAAGTEVRAVVSTKRSADGLRQLGAKVAVCDLLDTATLAVVMGGAYTVCHLAGGVDLADDAAYEASNLGTVQNALEAAVDADVTRFLFSSYPGASPDASNAFLRAKGRAEEKIESSGLQHVIIRATHVYGPGARWLEEMSAAATRPRSAVIVGPGTQRLAPVFVGDVVRVLAAADDRDVEIAGTFGLQGPDIVTADELADLLSGRRRRKVRLGLDNARRAARLLGRRLSPTLLEILAADSLADAADASIEFGVERTPLAEGLSLSRTT